MDTIPPSGYYYPNKIARIFLQAMEEIMGKNGLNAVLNMAKQPNLIDNYPPDNLEKEFDFAQFSALNGALEEMYGPRGGRGLALRGGRASFARGLQGFGALAGVGDLAFQGAAAGRQVEDGPAGHGGYLYAGQRSDQPRGREGRSLRIFHRSLPVLLGTQGGQGGVPRGDRRCCKKVCAGSAAAKNFASTSRPALRRAIRRACSMSTKSRSAKRRVRAHGERAC